MEQTGDVTGGSAGDAGVVLLPPASCDCPTQPGPLRLRLLAAALKPDSADRADLAAFLKEEGTGPVLLRWFGRDGLEALGWDRGSVLAALDRDIAAIDELLTDQVNAIIHHPRFQRLEASWRGLHYLAGQAEGAEGAILRVLNASWAELCRDFERAIDFDQSALFHKIYSEEFGTPGGRPYGALICDYEVQHKLTPGHGTDDVAGLLGLAQVAAAAFAPAIVGCTPALFGLESFLGFTMPFDVGAVFRQPEYQRWMRLQEKDDMRFIGVVLPRVLMREPYPDRGSTCDAFRYREDRRGLDADAHLWGSAVWAFGAVLLRAFGNYGWFADIRGTQRDVIGGGLVVDLPVPSFSTDAPGIATKYSSDVSLSENQEKELSDLGFIPLNKAKDTVYSVFYSNQSVYKPPKYDSFVANVNARMSSMLQYMFCVSRFAHFLKVIARDRIGTFASPEDIEQDLQRWLFNYVTGNDDAGADTKARYPLRDGRVTVRSAPGKPGAYQCIIHLKPHFQLDQVVSSFRLVTELTPPAA